MTDFTLFAKTLQDNGYNDILTARYCGETPKHAARLRRCADLFAETFGTNAVVSVFSAPGRTEICGNHTDHNHGKVLAASVNLDVLAIASVRDDPRVLVQSEGHSLTDIVVTDHTPAQSEIGHSAALIRGMCAGFAQRGYKIGGFQAATVSDVLSGSGLSSSAAFEVLIGTVLNHFFNGGSIPAPEIAKIAQESENRFFGKPCGLMDQMACSVGGFVGIDFADTANPIIEPIAFDFAACNHALCIVNTGGSHADLTEAYAAVREEMECVARLLGKSVLRDVSKEDLLRSITMLRAEAGDRAVLRALHFFDENDRVDRQTAALRRGDFETFKRLVVQSGQSSFMYNQNIHTGDPSLQSVALGLGVSEQILRGRGAWRVHGGGFAGTIQAFVPADLLESYRSQMETIFGHDSCYVLKIRPDGGVYVLG
ncbi:MAG: galactokinase [Oscillospiraceae bacterium]|nr:galactokinase [Oscillospiraceae bacterium]